MEDEELSTTSMNTIYKYTISPYDSASYKAEYSTAEDVKYLRRCLNTRLNNWCYTERGRSAIHQALSCFSIKSDDVVTILTTSGNYYISSCVTNEIERFCRWSRNIESNTRIIFINHEFGYPFKHPESLLKYKLPIIEDCAYGFFTEDPDDAMGKIGDFVIYSLSKAFSVKYGGILKCNNERFRIKNTISSIQASELETHLSFQIKDIEGIKAARLRNYNLFFSNLTPLGIEPFFKLVDGVIPGVILFKWRNNINYAALKTYMQEYGVESTVFYGKPAFYLPIHQNLDEGDINTICEMIRNFSK